MQKDFRAKVEAKAKEMLEAPNGDWTISDIIRVANRAGLKVREPTRGSHYTFSSPHLDQIETVPYKRPIRGVYVKKFALMVMSHLVALEVNDGN